RDGSTLPVNKKEAEGERRSRSRHHGARGCPSSASPGSSAPDAGAAGTNGSDTGPWRVDESWTDVQLLQERRHRTITPARLESRQGDPVQARDTRRSQLWHWLLTETLFQDCSGSLNLPQRADLRSVPAPRPRAVEETARRLLL